jgi:hypothetical protein
VIATVAGVGIARAQPAPDEPAADETGSASPSVAEPPPAPPPVIAPAPIAPSVAITPPPLVTLRPVTGHVGWQTDLDGFVQIDSVAYSQASVDDLDPATGAPLNQ